MPENIMIKYIVIILIISTTLFAQYGELELGKRYLKLGNTYREAGEYEDALKYLEEGRNLVINSDQYWYAVSNEYLGLLFRDIAYRNENKEVMLKKANEYFKSALVIYNKILTQKDGSQVALSIIKNNINDINNELNDLANAETYAMAGALYGNEEILNYDKLKLRNLPGEVSPNVKNLSLSENKFSDFPAALYRFQKLKYLNFSDNKIKQIPMGIGELNQLEYLDLSNNRIKNLPLDMTKLKSLKVLDLSENRLETLPPNMCEMQNLELLNLKNNKLEINSILLLVKCLPNTNVLFDEYERIDEQGEDRLQEMLDDLNNNNN